MLWGLTSGGWTSGLTAGADDPYRAQIELLGEYDLHATEWSAGHLLQMEPGRLEQIAGWLQERDVHVCLGLHCHWLSDDAGQLEQETETAMQAVDTLAEMMRTPLCGTGLSRQYHHYSRDLPLAEQVERFAEAMAPLAKHCFDAGCPLSIHKVAHFGEDLAALCSRAPGLGVLLDTGNAFLIGELPVAAARACAAYTWGSHFKDHYAFPNFNPIGLHLKGAVPGQGDAGLREIYGILLDEAPEPDKLVMLMEIDPVEGLTQRQALAQAVEFVNSL